MPVFELYHQNYTFVGIFSSVSTKRLTSYLHTIFTLCFIMGYACHSSAQGLHPKGSFFVYWGWNTERFTRSDLHLKGSDHDFTLHKIIAKDRQSKFLIKDYFNPSHLSIPQFNFRLGYFINDHYSISIGQDHMKYVMVQDQVARISGTIQAASRYDGTYQNEDIALTTDFLKFEHTNGLNYSNIEWRRTDRIIPYHHLRINLTTGIGAGVLIPRTDATLLNNDRYDEFHLAGYSAGGIVGINFTFFNSFFIQSELKGGFVHLPDIRTTSSPSDKASQRFWYAQSNLVFGVHFNLHR